METYTFMIYLPRAEYLCLNYEITPEEERHIASAAENYQSLADVPELSDLHTRLRSAAKEKIRKEFPDLNADEAEYAVDFNYEEDI